MKFKLIFTIFMIVLKSSYEFPVKKISNETSIEEFNTERMISFMETFGYLPRPDDKAEGLIAESLYASSAITTGIKNIQRFGGLEETGELNEDTLKLFSAPRCGVKDILNEGERHKRYIIGSRNWEKRQLTYYLANWSPKVNQSKMEEAAEKAFEAWAKYSRLKFKRVFDPSADIIIAFGSYYHGDRYPFDGPGNILAHAFYPYEENSFGGDIHFDNEENWIENAETMDKGVDFLSVLIHELGHSLGLAHSPVYSSLMFPYYKGTTPAQLDYDDILAMYQMYISRPLIENGEKELDQSTLSTIESDEIFEITKFNEEATTMTKTSTTESTTIADCEPIPDICEGFLDDVAYINSEIYVFKGKYVWKMDNYFDIEDGYPKKITQMFTNLPKRLKKIDAIYQDPNDENEIVIFFNDEFITYDPRGPIFSSYNITRYTLDPDIKKIDSAMVWAKNKKVYLFSSDRFWMYNYKYQMSSFYPRVMARWKGIPMNLDASVSIPEGKTIFFKQDEYWEYDNEAVKPKSGFPRKIYELFGHCEESN